MALHTPSHHVPTPHVSEHGRQVLRDLAVAILLALAVLLVFGAALTLRPGLPQLLQGQPDQPIVEFRAGERAAWEAGQTSEGRSIILFRAGERTER